MIRRGHCPGLAGSPQTWLSARSSMSIRGPVLSCTPSAHVVYSSLERRGATLDARSRCAVRGAQCGCPPCPQTGATAGMTRSPPRPPRCRLTVKPRASLAHLVSVSSGAAPEFGRRKAGTGPRTMVVGRPLAERISRRALLDRRGIELVHNEPSTGESRCQVRPQCFQSVDSLADYQELSFDGRPQDPVALDNPRESESR